MKKKIFFAFVLTSLMAIAVSCNNGGGNQVNNTTAAPSGQVPAAPAPVNGDDDRVVSASQLPQSAQDYINKFLPGKTIANVVADDDDINVTMQSGERLEFDLGGNIKKIEAYPELPAAVIDKRIVSDVKTIDPQAKIVKIDRNDYGGFEVKLSNGMEINYDASCQRLGFDD